MKEPRQKRKLAAYLPIIHEILAQVSVGAEKGPVPGLKRSHFERSEIRPRRISTFRTDGV